MLDRWRDALIDLPPLPRFAFALLILLAVPAVCRRVRLPAVVGLLAAGVLFGPHGLQVGPKHHEVADYFAEIGKLLLMFFAGLEVDLEQFQRTRNRSIFFGIATFGFPLLAGVAAGLAFGYGWLGAALIGSLLASHTLLGYPIVQRLGVVQNEAVTVTIGATIFTDIASLLVLAICIPIHTSGFSAVSFATQLIQLAIYIPVVLFGLSRVVGYFMEKCKDSKEGQFLIMLLAVAAAGIAAEAIHLEGIIGAFLAGLALNRAVHSSPAKKELEFLGNTLFIPVFFVVVGFLIDPAVFVRTIIGHWALVISIVSGLIGAKWLAARFTQRMFHYSRDESSTMWALSLPQVAATLAAALVAYEAKNPDGRRLIDEPLLNSVIVLMVVTSVLGPVMTEFLGKRLQADGSIPPQNPLPVPGSEPVPTTPGSSLTTVL